MDAQRSGTSQQEHVDRVERAPRPVPVTSSWRTGDDLAANAPLLVRIAAATIAAFVALTALVWLQPLTIGDRWTGALLLSQPGSLSWRFAQLVSFCAAGPVVAIAAVAIAAWTIIVQRRFIAGLAIVAAPAVAGVVETSMKSLVGRARPATMVLGGESGNGYPSGHVTGFTALVVVVFVVHVLANQRLDGSRTRWAAIAAVSVVVVSWSRIAVGAHYATDTYGGILLGVTIGLLCPIVLARLDDLRRARR